ncbi:diacylglycerol/lipid kinase family protein [Oceanobacillus kimchii]|uniref:diacylglycerol/lipid kinase family protein n=1 Tax=Oceanobacillus kimchii TaxID=746691 RepID=UPI00098685BB|nr:diacylglycerol kinase family protein [Oceanobacillus kimchii]
MKTVAVIINPNAGNQKLKNEINTIEARLKDVFEEVTVYTTEKEGDGKKIIEKIYSKVDLIIGGGGDGTIFELVNALAPLDHRPTFAVLPGGTCNDFSRTIGMNQNPLVALEQIVQKQTKTVDVGKYNDYYFLNFWGIGLISKVAEEMDGGNKKLLGKMSYYINTSKVVFQNETFQLKITSEEMNYDGEAVMMVVGNGPFLGGMKSFFPHADIQNGKFDVLIIKLAKLQHFWTWLETQMQNDYPDNRNDEVIYFRTSKLHVESSPEQNIDSDGEVLTQTPSEITILPKHLNVVIGDEAFGTV